MPYLDIFLIKDKMLANLKWHLSFFSIRLSFLHIYSTLHNFLSWSVMSTSWWLSLGLKDDLVCAPVSGLWNGSAAPVWICRFGGRLDTGAEAALWWWSWAASSSTHYSFSSDTLAMCVSTHQWGQTWAAILHLEGLMPHHLMLPLPCVLVALSWLALFLCPCASSQKKSCFGMHSSPIWMMWPARWSWALSSITLMEFDWAQSRTLRLVILSCHQIPRMEWSACILNFMSCLMWWW